MQRALTRPPLPAFLRLLAHEVRWQIVTALARSDRRGQELARLLGQPPNLVSYHLQRLQAARVVAPHRSAADRRAVYFSLDLAQLRALFAESGQALHPALAQPAGTEATVPAGAYPPRRVLFLCTHNSARSQMAEAILRHLSQGQVQAFSAGTAPGQVHPMALQVLAERGISPEGLRSKHLSEFEGQRFDYVVTVCDRAREACPIFPGNPEQIHWSFPDPAAVAGTARRLRAFRTTAGELTTRLNLLLLLMQREAPTGPGTSRAQPGSEA